MSKANWASRKAGGAVITRMQASVQPLNKSGGMAGTMAEE